MRIYEKTVFMRVRKIAKSDYQLLHFCASVCPSLWNSRLPMDGFSLIRYLNIFRKSVDKIQVSLKSNKHNGYFTWRPIIRLWTYLAHFFLEWEMFQTEGVGKIRTHILCSTIYIYIYFENRAVYGKTWKNIVQPDRPQITTWRMRIAYWIPKTTNTFRICNTYRFYSAAVVARMLLYVHCVSC